MPPGSKRRKAAKKKKEMEEQQQQQQQNPKEEEDLEPSSPGNGCHNGNYSGDSVDFANDSANGHQTPHYVVGKDSEVGPLPPPPPPPQNDHQEEDGELYSHAQTKKHKEMEANGPGEEVKAAEKEVAEVEEAPPVEAEDKAEPLKVSIEAEDQQEMAVEKLAVGELIDVPDEQVVVHAVEEAAQKADEVPIEVIPAEVVEDVKQKDIEVLAEVVKEATEEVKEVQAEVAEEVTPESQSAQAEVAEEVAPESQIAQAEVAEVSTAESKDVLTEVAEEALMAAIPPPSQDREVKVVPIDVADDEAVEKPGEISRANHAIATAATSVTTEVAHQPPLVKHTTWWNCCGLLDVFVGSER